MKLRELIDLVHHPQKVQIRNEEGWEICTCNTNSEGVLPYLNWVVTEWFGNYMDGKTDFVVFVTETVDVPTVDAVEVIRCKNCKHFDRNEIGRREGGMYNICSEGRGMFLSDDDFCSSAERKEE